ncbi:flavin monoamine oxidase family protein [Rhodococcus koreensis]|uniref:flavin monoamine oxidase family protein n=1 Tax=Rhodococcus koreensis TaxID=99653 RepID=UPI00366E86C5
MVDFDVIVVGAGFAGATAARDLAERGLEVGLLEAHDHVGGRAYSRKFRGRDELVELGGQYFLRSRHSHVVAEIARYGVATKQGADASPVFVNGGVRRKALPVPAEELGELERAWFHLYHAAQAVASDIAPSTQPHAHLDIPAMEFFAPLNLAPTTSEFIESVLSLWLHADPRTASILSVLRQVAAFGYSPLALVASISEGFETFEDGTASLATAMAAHPGIHLRLSTPVSRISHGDGRVTVTTATGEEFGSKACVVAVPTQVMLDIDYSPPLSAEKQETLGRDSVSRPYKICMLVDGLESVPFCMGMGPMQMMAGTHQLADGLQIVSAFGAESVCKVDPNSIEAAQEALDYYYDGAKVLAVDTHDWMQDPYIKAGPRQDAAGFVHRFSRILNEPEGALVFAGADMVDSLWRNWINGAIESGHNAADRADSIIGRQ